MDPKFRKKVESAKTCYTKIQNIFNFVKFWEKLNFLKALAIPLRQKAHLYRPLPPPSPGGLSNFFSKINQIKFPLSHDTKIKSKFQLIKKFNFQFYLFLNPHISLKTNILLLTFLSCGQVCPWGPSGINRVNFAHFPFKLISIIFNFQFKFLQHRFQPFYSIHLHLLMPWFGKTNLTLTFSAVSGFQKSFITFFKYIL